MIALLVSLGVSACSHPASQQVLGGENIAMTLSLTSPVFTNGAPIPDRDTCDGANVSPPLKWMGTPSGAKSLALICEDPDAPGGTWTHWVLYNIPPTTTELPEGVPATPSTPDKLQQGTNDFKQAGYGGPCPPGGASHRYFFRLYALDTELSLPAGTTEADLLQAIKGHILAGGELMGTYKRR